MNMYGNLKELCLTLDPKDKNELLEILGYDKTRLSKKINCKYSKYENFNADEKKIIHLFLEKTLKKKFDEEWLFEIHKKIEKKITYVDEKVVRLNLAIDRAKELNGITEVQICRKLGVETNMLWHYKTGKVNIPEHRIDKLAQILDVTPDFLNCKMKEALPYKFRDFTSIYFEQLANKANVQSSFTRELLSKYNIEKTDKELLTYFISNTFEYLYDILETEILLEFYGKDRSDFREFANMLKSRRFERIAILQNNKRKLAQYIEENRDYKSAGEKFHDEIRANDKWTYYTETEKKLLELSTETVQKMTLRNRKK